MLKARKIPKIELLEKECNHQEENNTHTHTHRHTHRHTHMNGLASTIKKHLVIKENRK